MIEKQELIKEFFEPGKEAFNSGNLFKAQELFEKAITIIPEHFQSLNYLGLILKKQGNFREAIEKFNLALMQSGSYEIYENIGLCLFQLGEFEKAENFFNRVIMLNSDYANVYANLASVLQIQGKYAQAILNYRKYIKLIPDNPDIYNNIGLALEEEGKHPDAENNFRQAIKLNPGRFNFFYNLAINLQIQKKHEEAIKYFEKAIELNPDNPDFYNNLAVSWQSLQQYVQASENYRKAITIFPGNPDFFNNLGSVLDSLGQYSEAITNYKQAIQLAPDGEKNYYNLAVSQEKTGEYEQAINNYLQAIRLKPDYADAHWNLSLLLLLNGEFKIGWKEYEWRFLADSAEKIISDKPRWEGGNPAGKTICIKHEQGFGDAIQFCRFLPMLQGKGTEVILECPAELKRLFESIQGYDFLTEKNKPEKLLPEFDFYLPLMSLPLIFGTTVDTIPASVPYIKADPMADEKWHKELGKRNGVKVGIVWEGNPQNKNNQRRFCPLSHFYDLAGKLNINFFSLQKGNASIQLKDLPSKERIIDLSGAINDFTDTAAIINNLDLLISVDTAVVHLAGALGRPVWTLLHFNPDWRWLLNRKDSPWYPTMELFRQPVPGDWDSVFEDIQIKLRERFPWNN